MVGLIEMMLLMGFLGRTPERDGIDCRDCGIVDGRYAKKQKCLPCQLKDSGAVYSAYNECEKSVLGSIQHCDCKGKGMV